MTHSSARDRKDDDSAKALSYFGILSLISIISCFIVRAPTIFEKIKIPVIDLELILNAGYILVFGPLLIFCAIAAILYLSRDSRPGGTVVYNIVRAVPCMAAVFLSLQFFLLLAPKGQCLTFRRWRYLIDPTLSAFQPEYCMSLPAETQQHMPWLISPVMAEAWAQVLLPLIAIGLVIKDMSAAKAVASD